MPILSPNWVREVRGLIEQVEQDIEGLSQQVDVVDQGDLETVILSSIINLGKAALALPRSYGN